MSLLAIVDEYMAKENLLREAEIEHGQTTDDLVALRSEVRALRSAIGIEDEPTLTLRQAQVVQMIAEGMTNEQIGDAIYLSPETVRTHLRAACKKLGARGRAHMVHLAHQKGILS